jgi:hypothetical protein
VMFHSTLSDPIDAAAASRERLGLLMGGSSGGEIDATIEASHALGA